MSKAIERKPVDDRRSIRGHSSTPSSQTLRIGTAGWNVPAFLSDTFPAGGSHLERYATRMNCVEINTSFYRPHQPKTYARWARSTPKQFRFSVKLPQAVSHAEALHFEKAHLAQFFQEVIGLGEKLGVILVQFPPSLAFNRTRATALFDRIRHHTSVAVACEPRHESWFTENVDRWMAEREIARVAADPARIAGADEPGGWRGFSYLRLHGSPRIYYSNYDEAALNACASRIGTLVRNGSVWCIFDNTAAGAALGNALALEERLRPLYQVVQDGRPARL
jgi:uncharacterized protein YecE (DUF72 family)